MTTSSRRLPEGRTFPPGNDPPPENIPSTCQPSTLPASAVVSGGLNEPPCAAPPVAVVALSVASGPPRGVVGVG
jgi:hypothetical protein